MKPTFEEKTYECAANLELGQQNKFIYSPGQVAEAILGVDVIVHPSAASPVWVIMQQVSPPGLLLSPALWAINGQPVPSVTLPSFVTSLMIQYKRPDYMATANAKQYQYWKKSYYRIDITPDQQSILERLDQRLTGHAIVRYASPAFHLYTQLERYQQNGQILANSNFARPAALTGHRVWTYASAGSAGYANPEPEAFRLESWKELSSVLLHNQDATSVSKHLRSIGKTLIESDMAQDIEVPRTLLSILGDSEKAQALADLILIGNVMGRLGASWWLEVSPETKQS